MLPVKREERIKENFFLNSLKSNPRKNNSSTIGAKKIASKANIKRNKLFFSLRVKTTTGIGSGFIFKTLKIKRLIKIENNNKGRIPT